MLLINNITILILEEHELETIQTKQKILIHTRSVLLTEFILEYTHLNRFISTLPGIQKILALRIDNLFDTALWLTSNKVNSAGLDKALDGLDDRACRDGAHGFHLRPLGELVDGDVEVAVAASRPGNGPRISSPQTTKGHESEIV